MLGPHQAEKHPATTSRANWHLHKAGLGQEGAHAVLQALARHALANPPPSSAKRCRNPPERRHGADGVPHAREPPLPWARPSCFPLLHRKTLQPLEEGPERHHWVRRRGADVHQRSRAQAGSIQARDALTSGHALVSRKGDRGRFPDMPPGRKPHAMHAYDTQQAHLRGNGFPRATPHIPICLRGRACLLHTHDPSSRGEAHRVQLRKLAATKTPIRPASRASGTLGSRLKFEKKNLISRVRGSRLPVEPIQRPDDKSGAEMRVLDCSDPDHVAPDIDETSRIQGRESLSQRSPKSPTVQSLDFRSEEF